MRAKVLFLIEIAGYVNFFFSCKLDSGVRRRYQTPRDSFCANRCFQVCIRAHMDNVFYPHIDCAPSSSSPCLQHCLFEFLQTDATDCNRMGYHICGAHINLGLNRNEESNAQPIYERPQIFRETQHAHIHLDLFQVSNSSTNRRHLYHKILEN